MTTASFIAALPKVELSIQLAGAIQPKTITFIAERNEISASLKHFDNWLKLMHEPDVSRLYDIIRMAASWLKTADDLTYIVYDLGTWLSKQNVRYAEVCVDPLLFPDLNLSYDGVLNAINDGRDRAKRAWGVDMAWIFTIPAKSRAAPTTSRVGSAPPMHSAATSSRSDSVVTKKPSRSVSSHVRSRWSRKRIRSRRPRRGCSGRRRRSEGARRTASTPHHRRAWHRRVTGANTGAARSKRDACGQSNSRRAAQVGRFGCRIPAPCPLRRRAFACARLGYAQPLPHHAHRRICCGGRAGRSVSR